jgi:tRNA threonylcarbamoyladenosine biosynthesis protein TsaE
MMIFFPNELSLLSFGEKLAHAVTTPAVIFLEGPLGVGKTTLTRGFLRGLGFKDRVKSPTYTLVEPYMLNEIMVFHFDLYRLQDPHELEFIGIQDYFNSHAICLIEWPEKGSGVLPKPDLVCQMTMEHNGRNIECIASSDLGHHILHQMTYE